MPDPLRVKLVSESASGLASASISPSEATRNGIRLACVTCYKMLRFWAFSRTCETRSWRKLLVNSELWLLPREAHSKTINATA